MPYLLIDNRGDFAKRRLKAASLGMTRLAIARSGANLSMPSSLPPLGYGKTKRHFSFRQNLSLSGKLLNDQKSVLLPLIHSTANDRFPPVGIEAATLI